MDKVKRIKELVTQLNEASVQYYKFNREIMSNLEYDALYDELLALENETNIIMANSPTQKVQGEMIDELKKVKHSKPMLSADKTKNVNDLAKFIGNKEGILSWKLDGLTIVITYIEGKYNLAVTRGGGDVGEDATHSIRTCINLPLTIPYKGLLVIRGECTISYNNFEKINNTIPDIDSKYKNPRNLASGSVRQLDSNIAAQRHLEFRAFNIELCDIKPSTKDRQFELLKSFGIETVDYKLVNKDNVVQTVDEFNPSNFGTPVDGLILEFNDVTYGSSLGSTNHHTLNMIALKWEDELVETKFRGVELKTSRYGIASITAIFDTVEIDGTTVSRASLHNVDIFNSLQLGIGDTIQVYKANMIIPQIDENLDRSGTYQLPMICPSCGKPLQIVKRVDTNELYCDNDYCQSKLIQRLTHFVSKDAMNIVGVSESKLETLIELGLLNKFEDLYSLHLHKKDIIDLDGFGKKSYDNLISAIEASKNTKLENLIYALGIRNIGNDVSKKISKQCNGDIKHFAILINSNFNWSTLDGVGDVISQSIKDYFYNKDNWEDFIALSQYLNIITASVNEESTTGKSLSGLTFVITGSVEHFKNRDELKAKIEELQGKVSGSVSAKTSFLINNDNTSTSGKNKSAKELGVKIIAEDEFLEMIK